MESSQKQQDILEDQKKQHKCCVGLSFYTQQLRLQRRDPSKWLRVVDER